MILNISKREPAAWKRSSARLNDSTMVSAEQNGLSIEAIEGVLRQPNGPYVLLELVRMGRVDSKLAAKALGRFDRPPLFKRVFLAFVDAVFPNGEPSRR